MPSREEVQEALTHLGEAVTTLGTALFDRLDRIVILLSNQPDRVQVEAVETPPPKTEIEAPRKTSRNGSDRQPPQTAEVQTFDPYTTSNTVKIVRLLLREDVRAVGKVTKSIADELQLSESSTKRLINTIHEGLPFLLLTKRGGSHSLRIKPGHYDDAEAWLSTVHVEEARHDFGDYRCSDESFAVYAPRIVRALLQGDKATNVIYAETGIRQSMFRGVMNRLMPEGFIRVPVAPRGSPPVLQVTDRDRAQRWLAQRSSEATNGLPRPSTLLS